MEELEISLWNQCTIDSGLLYSNNLFPWDFKPVVLLADGLLREMWEAAAGRERLFIYLCTLLLEISKSAQLIKTGTYQTNTLSALTFSLVPLEKSAGINHRCSFMGDGLQQVFNMREKLSVFLEKISLVFDASC